MFCVLIDRKLTALLPCRTMTSPPMWQTSPKLSSGNLTTLVEMVSGLVLRITHSVVVLYGHRASFVNSQSP